MTTHISPIHRGVHTAPFTFVALLVTLLLTLGGGPAFSADQAVAEKPASTVNINTADAETLAAGLFGVGLARAEDIIRYREQFGPFTTVEQITEVKGIGSAMLDKNRARITLD